MHTFVILNSDLKGRLTIMITIKDIAKAAGVNHSTVSRALRDDLRVSTAMREKIHTIAKQMNYVPNLAAKKLVRQKTNFVGLIWPPREGLFFYNMNLQLQLEGIKRGYRVMQIMDGLTDSLQAFRQFGVDHVMFWDAYSTLPASFAVERQRFPGRVLALGGYNKSEGVDWLAVDRSGALLQAVRHLSALGHRQLAYAGGQKNKQKMYGFLQGIAECKADYTPEHFFDYFGTTFEDDVHAVFQKPDRPSAIVVDSQHCLFRLMRALRPIRVRVPDDVSVVVYDDTPEMSAFEIAFTTVGPSIPELAVKAWDIMTAEPEPGEERELVEEMIGAVLVPRESAIPFRPEMERPFHSAATGINPSST
ncbi:MAG: hypothetical protein K0Q94_1035 [Paenibacillus sp.]|nr:hypothetical protein [Paenibacillus sp.]